MRSKGMSWGFSLAEVAVAIVVVGLAAPPMTALLQNVLTKGVRTQKQLVASGLAQGLMNEILSREFEDPDSSPGSFGTEEGARANYDDVDDYDGLNETPPRDSRGGTLANFPGFRSQVTVQNVTAASPDGAAQADGSTDFKRVTVTVSWDDGAQSLTLEGLRSSFDLGGDGSGSGTATGLINIQRLNASWKDCKFRFKNDTGDELYLTHLTATWSSPTAYYQKIRVKVWGWRDVWEYQDHGYVRMGSGETAMFNQGERVRVPDGATVDILLDEFRSSPTGGSSRNMDNTQFSIELWAVPTQFAPITIPPE